MRIFYANNTCLPTSSHLRYKIAHSAQNNNHNASSKRQQDDDNNQPVHLSFLIVVITLLHHTSQDASNEASVRVTDVSMRFPFLDELFYHLMRRLGVLCPGTFVNREVSQHVRSRFCRQQSDRSCFQILLRQSLTDRF
jgi:hypothetical protein